MKFQHAAALLLPLASTVTALPIGPRSDNGVLNLFSTIGDAGDPNKAAKSSLFGILKRQITGISFDPFDMLNKALPLKSLPVISGLRKRDAEANGDQEKRGLDGLLNIGSDVGGSDVANHQGGLFGIFKRQLPGLGFFTSLTQGLPFKLPLAGGVTRRNEVEKRGGLLGLGCLLNVGSDLACADQGPSGGLLGRRQIPGLSILTSLIGNLGGQKDTTTTPTLPNGQQLPGPQQFGQMQVGQPGMPGTIPGATM